MEVMLEIYNTLKTLGMEWKEKGGVWGRYVPDANGHTNGAGEHEGEADGDCLEDRENGDIYFVQTRWRVRDVVVRMDLQLYQVAPGSYLVDFRNVGAYNASTSPTAASLYERAPFPYTPSSTPSFTFPSPFASPLAQTPSYISTPFPSPLTERCDLRAFTPIKHCSSGGVADGVTSQPIEKVYLDSGKKEVDVFSPFLFLECACRLIVELAGAS
jgi:carbon catabolite-derepressing protein kinase